MRATLSLSGLYDFDNTVLDGMNYPDKFTDVDKETFVANLLMETAELEILYPDVKFMMTAIRAWSKKEKPVWDKLFETTILEYNPIWNKDGTVTETETIGREGSESSTENATGSETETDTKETARANSRETATKSDSESTATDETNHYVYGYNSDSAAQDEKTDGKSTTSGSGSASGSESEKGSETENGSRKNNSTNDIKRAGEHAETTQRTNTRIEKGNIGVTTTQSMIEEERAVDLFNLFDVMIESFKKRFCIMIY